MLDPQLTHWAIYQVTSTFWHTRFRLPRFQTCPLFAIFPKPACQRVSLPSIEISLSTRLTYVVPDGLPPPSEGLKVHHVAVGRGTQNYTCDTSDPTSAPTLAGAVAVLFNATCVASLYPDLLDQIPGMAVHFNLTNAHQLGPSTLPVSGVHYFTNGTTPFFDLQVQGQDIGDAPCAKNASIPAPSNAAVGQKGEAAVPWLKLNTREGATGNMKEVYRVTTAGGSAPKTCEGMPAAFEVQYATV